MDPAHACAALDWLLELGADEAIGDLPVDRTALSAEATRAVPATPPPVAAAPAVQVAPKPEEEARDAADLAALAAAMQAFDCELKAGAQKFVLSDGTPGAPLMVIGEAPGRDEDRAGKPFVGPAGQLLDRMLGAIGRDRADPDPSRAVYIANVLPWRPPGNRTPTDAEVARWAPFLRRHVELARPRLLLLVGNTPARALLGQGGITRLRGEWREALGLPALPTFHPSYLLHLESREPEAWRDARRKVWDDLKSVQARLETS